MARGRAEGIDAILMMGRFLAELADLDARLQARRQRHPLVGPASLHAGAIRGGLGPSIYPDRASSASSGAPSLASRRRRCGPKSTPFIGGFSAADPATRADTQVLFSRPPYEFDASRRLAGADHLTAAIERTDRRAPAPMGHTAWMDSAILGAAGIPSIVFGPRR